MEEKIMYVPASVKRTLSTKIDKDSKAVLTQVTYDLKGLSVEDLLQYAYSRMDVKVQDKWRRDGVIPTVFVWAVPAYGGRSATQIDHNAALVKALGPEKAAKMIAKFGSAEAACQALQALLEAVEGESEGAEA